MQEDPGDRPRARVRRVGTLVLEQQVGELAKELFFRMGGERPFWNDRDSAENCSIRRTLDIVGEKWTLLVLREAFYGVRRFDDYARALGCARNVLSARLLKLVEEDILERVPYREPGRRPRVEYRLTGKGRELFPALLALMQWGDRWTADPAGPAVEVLHRDCGEPVSMEMVCAAGHGKLSVRDTRAVPGAGARKVA